MHHVSEVVTAGGERIEGDVLVELYVRHADRAMRVAYLLTGDRALAEDIVQEAFLRLFGRFLHIRNRAAFDAYLRRTVVNLANSHHRRRRAERSSLARRSGLRDPEPASRDLGEADAMRRALLRLPPRQRTAIVLRFYEDLSEQQTADVMRCAVGTVKSLVSRGRETLRASVRAQESE
ncbi:MAG TPA: SigE family RNA polymerase sigma factor [Actinomycetota bacterium]|jgi:RNA polymerase sigma-70 factor (sigma-E family)